MKTIIVTGGSRGIGASIVKELANKDYNIVLNYNNSEEQAKQKLTPEEKAQRKADRKAKFKAMNEKNGTRWQAVKYLLCTASAGIIQFVSFTIMTYAFAKLYSDRTQWEARRDTLRREIRQRLGIDSYLDSCVVGKKAILSKVRRYDGYTVQNICIETLPGEHIYGSIYNGKNKTWRN